jgi:hypothetical protein
MDVSPLLSDGQVAVLASAIGGAALLIGGAIRWGVGRLVKSIDEGTADARQVRQEVIELKAEVREGRQDIRELREIAERHLKPLPRRTRRAMTAPTGVPRVRAADDNNR